MEEASSFGLEESMSLCGLERDPCRVEAEHWRPREFVSELATELALDAAVVRCSSEDFVEVKRACYKKEQYEQHRGRSERQHMEKHLLLRCISSSDCWKESASMCKSLSGQLNVAERRASV